MQAKLNWAAPSFLAGSLALVLSAQAGYSPIGTPYPGEANTKDILNNSYGENFHKVGVDYVGTNFNAYRVQDTAFLADADVSTSNPLNLGVGLPNVGGDSNGTIQPNTSFIDPTDQTWSGQGVYATAQAKFALYSQSFGYFNGLTGSVYHPILDVTGSQFDVGGSGIITGLGNEIFRFARTGDNGTFSSVNTQNPGFFDHMITYEMVYTGNDESKVRLNQYMVFWEDKNLSDVGSDYDYNDMAIEIDIVSVNGSNNAIPEPASISILGLGGAALLRRRRAK